jgi:tape measure domain-containing protein
MAIEIGTAYVSIGGRTDQLAKDVKDALNGVGRDATQAGNQIGHNLGSGVEKALRSHDLGKAVDLPTSRASQLGERFGLVVGKGVGAGIKVGIAGAATLAASAVGALGYTLTKGFQRLETLDQAQFKLRALGHSADEVTLIMDSAQKSVKGTAFSMADAATAAASAVAAGIKPGEQLTKYLSEVGDAAAVAGTSFEDMGAIFNKIQTSNKAFTDDLNQLSDRGLPIFSWLQEEYGVTAAALSKMVQDGEVDAAHFEDAIQKHIGGAALNMGESFSGAVDNAQAAVARLGASFLASIFGGSQTDALAGPKEAVKALTDQLDKANTWVSGHQEQIKQFFYQMRDAAKTVVDAVKGVLDFLDKMGVSVGDVVIAFAAWKTIEGVVSLTSSLKAIKGMLSTDLPAAAALGAGGITAALAKVAVPTWLMYMIGQQNPAVNNDLPFPNGSPNIGNDGRVPVIDKDGNVVQTIPGLFSDPGLAGPAPGGSAARRGVGPTSALDPNFLFPRGGQQPGGDPVRGFFGPQVAPAGFSTPLPARVPYGLPANANSGGYGGGGVAFPDWVNQLGAAFGVKPSTYPGHQDTNRQEAGFAPNPLDLNRGIDWTGSPENLQRFADYLASIPQDLEQVIWQNPATGSRTGIAGGHPVGNDYYANDWGAHTNHVHTRQSESIPLPPWLQQGTYDSGGKLPPGLTLARNNTGQDEHVLTGSQLQDMRTSGAIPAGAGNTQEAGTSGVSKLIDIGGEVINGLIDQAASAAATAVGLAATAGSFGAGGQAGGALASAAIGLGANAAKRGVTWGFDELGIGVDAVHQILSPFNAGNRGKDFSGFVPSDLITKSLTDLMSGGADKTQGPANPVDPNTTQHGDAAGAAPGPQQPELFPNAAINVVPLNGADGQDLAPGQNGAPLVAIGNMFATDTDAAIQQQNKQLNLAIMQNEGRPFR